MEASAIQRRPRRDKLERERWPGNRTKLEKHVAMDRGFGRSREEEVKGKAKQRKPAMEMGAGELWDREEERATRGAAGRNGRPLRVGRNRGGAGRIADEQKLEEAPRRIEIRRSGSRR
jgi:hypothetical protein